VSQFALTRLLDDQIQVRHRQGHIYAFAFTVTEAGRRSLASEASCRINKYAVLEPSAFDQAAFDFAKAEAMRAGKIDPDA
jgi:hypothetical protein